jgi:hypothetical protein
MLEAHRPAAASEYCVVVNCENPSMALATVDDRENLAQQQ